MGVRNADGHKQCARCSQWRAPSEYRPDLRSSDGLKSWCSPCSSDYMTIARYGISRAAVLAMVEEQGGCAICGTRVQKSPGFRNGWHVDHDHTCCPGDRTCGECVRGVLCANCNKLIGLAQDSTPRLARAIQYLESRG